jgi:hypothetical protein
MVDFPEETTFCKRGTDWARSQAIAAQENVNEGHNLLHSDGFHLPVVCIYSTTRKANLLRGKR